MMWPRVIVILIWDVFVMHYIYDTANGILRTVGSELDFANQTVGAIKVILHQVTSIPPNRQILLEASGTFKISC